MANTVAKRTLLDDARYYVVHVHLLSDGASGELTDQVLVDPADCTYVDPQGNPTAPTSFTVVKIWHSLVGFDGHLEFDATTDQPVWKIQGGAPGDNTVDLREIGGLADPRASGYTGKIQITTAGFTAATDQGTLIIWCKKEY